ncbi:26S proteasome non-ATPase regulatory subunit 10-like isoform X4 [Pomacea canaliculata]|nr:26S proteasome non-ATPase regulatory subunit 10-like isoform X4 [Pomacea canaliculata]XP_025095339.1 26S proteasome non-ATPase regulatory subunit 10-like isoform X4 [Pomacea canaliculata]XP_025095340.1 26S proteasome non-ATPase regulatory subunit 10-like isoform X4 [Pomacea canaliculata]
MGFLSRLWHCGLQFVPPVYLWTWNVWTVCLEIKMPGTREPAFKSAASSPCQAYIPGNAEIAKRQIEMKQVDVNKIVSSLDLTYFLCACLSGDGGLVDYMIKKGANVHSETTEGDSALYLATFAVLNLNRDNLDVLKVLINAGCNVNHQNKRGFTPLHRAASKGNCKIIKFLLEQGANPNIVNAAGVYPIDSAVCAGYLEAAKLLKIELPNPYVWDVVEPHTPPHITLGLQSPSRREILLSTRSQVFEKVFKEKNKNSFKYS